jgi:hypothetical protein
MSFNNLSQEIEEEFASLTEARRYLDAPLNYEDGLTVTDNRAASIGEDRLTPHECAVNRGRAAAASHTARWRRMTADDFRAMAARHPGYRATAEERVRRKNDLRNVRRRRRDKCRRMGRPPKAPRGIGGQSCHGDVSL